MHNAAIRRGPRLRPVIGVKHAPEQHLAKPRRTHAPKRRRYSRKAIAAAAGLLLTLAGLTTWLSTRTHIVDLGNEQQLSDSGLLQDWAQER